MDETKMYYLGTGTEFIKAQCKPYKTIERALKAAAKDESLVVWDEDGNIIGSLTDVVPDGALETNGDGSVNAYDADGQQVGTVNAETVAAVTGDKSQSTGGEDMQQGDTETAKNGTGDNEQANTQPDAGNGENGANTQPQSTGGEDMQQGDAETAKNGTGDNEQANTQPDAGNGENGANTQPQNTGDENVQQDGEPEQEQVKEQTGRFNITVVCEGSLRLRRSASFTIDNECGRASKGQTYVGKRIFMCDGLPMVETIDGLFLSAAACHVSIEKVE